MAKRTYTTSSPTPAFENSVNIQMGEPEENKLMRSLLRAGQFGAAAGLGSAVGAAANSMAFENSEMQKPVYDRRLTEAQHAVDNASGLMDENPYDYALYEGVRQGLIGGAITPTDVNQMIIEERFSPRAEVLVSDIHDSSGPELHTNPRLIAQMVDEMGGDGMAYLEEQQALRNAMGIDVPV